MLGAIIAIMVCFWLIAVVLHWVGSICIGGGGSGHPRAISIGMFAAVKGALLAPVIQREAEASRTRQALCTVSITILHIGD